MVEPADPGDGPLDAKAETGMRDGAVPPEIEIPLERLLREIMLPDPPQEQIIVVLTLAPADDLPVPLGGEDIHGERQLVVLGVALHVEGLDLGRVSVDDD